jgi:Ca-activated chloride channel family protein
MKNRLVLSLILLLCLCFSPSFSQNGTLIYSIQVNGQRNIPEANLDIVLIETSTFQREVFTTDINGQTIIELSEGRDWIMHVGEMKNYTKITRSEYGGKGSATVHYDVERWKILSAPPINREKYKFEEIVQKGISSDATPQKGFSIIEIELQNGKGQKWRTTTVQLTSIQLKKSFIAYTDAKGIARFYVPNNQHYQIDVDGEIDYDFIDVGNQSYTKRMSYLYEKINFKEQQNSKGEIEQTFEEEPKPISNRVMVKLHVNGGPNDGIKEDVYLEPTYSNKKYHGVTDENGDVIFMLPKKRSYLVSFPLQKHAASIDLTYFRGIGQMNDVVNYTPDERLQYPEKFLPTKDAVDQYDLTTYLPGTYKNTDDDNLINVHATWGSNKINSNSLESILELGFSVKPPRNKEMIQKPLNVAFVLDRSGSMDGENINLLKESMLQFISKLRPIDNVSLVFFNDESVLAYKQQKADKAHLSDIIEALTADGGTNIYEGLKMGYEQISTNYNPKATNRVILLTDGYGSKPIDFVIDQSKQYFTKGISVSTIGVGQDYNNALLSLLSKYSGGFEHQVIEAEGISEALNNEFESLFYPLASNLTVKVKYNNRIIYKTLYGVPEVSNTNSEVVFKLDKVFCSLNKLVLMKFKLENLNPNIDKDKVILEVSYFDEQKSKDVTIIKPINLEWSKESDLELIYDNSLKQIYSVAQINQCLKAIADLCDAKNYTAAKANISQTLEAINKTTSSQYSPELLPLVNKLKDYLETIEIILEKEK